ncbi:hypothetical protein LY78DRAFT_451390 [Colletotrichum sublineola]|nr:hypothetical protein LY78DRAFT_451390 [Colletotrichum sublineola]
MKPLPGPRAAGTCCTLPANAGRNSSSRWSAASTSSLLIILSCCALQQRVLMGTADVSDKVSSEKGDRYDDLRRTLPRCLGRSKSSRPDTKVCAVGAPSILIRSNCCATTVGLWGHVSHFDLGLAGQPGHLTSGTQRYRWIALFIVISTSNSTYACAVRWCHLVLRMVVSDKRKRKQTNLGQRRSGRGQATVLTALCEPGADCVKRPGRAPHTVEVNGCSNHRLGLCWKTTTVATTTRTVQLQGLRSRRGQVLYQ